MADKRKPVQIRLREKDAPELSNWIENQANISASIRKLIMNHVERHGTGDLDSPAVQLTMAQDLLVLSGTQTPVSVPKTVVEFKEVEVPKEEIEEETVPAVEEKNSNKNRTKKKAAVEEHDASVW